MTKEFDTDGDNVVSEKDITIAEREVQLRLDMSRAGARRWMAIAALGTQIVFTLMLFSPWIKTSRVDALSEISGMFYISMSGIVAAYFGTTAWLSSKPPVSLS